MMFARLFVALTLFQIINASHKTREDFDVFIDLLDDDDSGNRNDRSSISEQEEPNLLNSDQLESLNDHEKEIKLRKILNLLKKENNARALQKDLQKLPVTPRLFVIDNPDVLQDFKKYLYNKRSPEVGKDLNYIERVVRRNNDLKKPKKSKSKKGSKHKKLKQKSNTETKSKKLKESEPNKFEPPIPSNSSFNDNEDYDNSIKVVSESTKPKRKRSKGLKRKKPKVKKSEASPDGETRHDSETKLESETRPTFERKPEIEARPDKEDNQDDGPGVGTFLGDSSERQRPKNMYSNEAFPKRYVQKDRDPRSMSEERPKPRRERPMPRDSDNDRPLGARMKKVGRPSNFDDESSNQRLSRPIPSTGNNRNRYDSDGPSRNRYNDSPRNRYDDYPRNRDRGDSGRKPIAGGRTPIPYGGHRNVYEKE